MLRAPRWVLEGYATVIEGRLTGAGRPTSTFRALLLRRWAESGRLPTYGELNSSQRFAGMSMAYLMGSAYLEWLEQRGSLRDLWARLTARHRRSFDEAFIGVFGDRPDRLYGRFLAEVTASAIAIDKQRTLHEGELFQETPRASGEPAVSPDGKQLAIVIRAAKDGQPDKLVVWSTGPPEEEKKVEARDPEDVPAIRTKPLPRKAVHSLTLRDGGDILTPRWTRDGKSIVFSHRTRDAEGFLHFDLYRWDFENVTRITYDADVHDADPYGASAVAVRSRFGATQLVDVDLNTGAVTPRGDASIDVVYTHPRMSAGGKLAYVAHREGQWTLFVDEKLVELPGDASSPEWMGESIVTTVARAGFAELYRDGVLITITRGGAFDPAPSNDGRIFFMTLDPDGYILHVLTNPTPIPQPPIPDGQYVPAIPPVPTQPAAFVAEPLTSRGYGIGRQEWSWFSGVNIARGQNSFEVGARLGDVVGRLDTLLMVSNEPRGVALASAWRGWPVELHAHAYRVEDRHSCLSIEDRQECLSSTGLELRAKWSRYRFTIEGGALSNEFAFASASFSPRQVFGTWRLEESLHVAVDDNHQRAIIGAALRSGFLRIAARVQHDRGDDLVLGGLASSILPRSAYARRVLDPALPVAALRGSDYDGWRVEAKVPSLPITAFYQRHELGGARISVRGLEAQLRTDPFPILKLPAVDVTAGVAQTGSDTNWWLGMRWHP